MIIAYMLEHCIQTPYIYLSIQSSISDIFSIRGNDNSEDFIVVQERVSDWSIGLKVPDSYRAVRCRGNKMAFIRGKTEGVYGIGMTLENNELLSINRPPFSNGVIIRRGENVCAVLGPT
jgi:hypothetical protein